MRCDDCARRESTRLDVQRTGVHTLDYDPDVGGYVVNLTKEQLQNARAYSMEELVADDGMKFRERMYDYYGATRYW
jgi:hypothetical protein